MSKRRLFIAAICAAFLVSILSGCLGSDTVLIRSDPPNNGMQAAVQYTINATPDGKSETNHALYQGVNDISPLPLLTTSFGRGAGTKTQTVQATADDGSARNVLGMSKRKIEFGLTDFLTSDIATYEMRDAKGARVCGAKVRMTFKPNIAQKFLHDRLGRAWDALWYYNVPCANTPAAKLDLGNAKLTGLVVNQVFNLYITGKPVLFRHGNRGHSVTIMDGAPARLKGGWWTSNIQILKAAALIRDMTHDLDRDSNRWKGFTPGGRFSDSWLSYSAGDADVYNLKRVFLHRQSDYVVYFRHNRAAPWRSIIIQPKYNIEWNDLKQNWKALKGQDLPDIDGKVDQDTGIPKDAEDAELKEIETAGCQNCPNATLEQIRFLDGQTGRPLYAMTVRGYLGANSSLVMFGKIPRISIDQALEQADATKEQRGYKDCPIRRGKDGKKLDGNQQITGDQCADLLREGSLWDMITQNPEKFGFDVMGQFQVRDNSTWTKDCSDSGCTMQATDQKLNASYQFNHTDQRLTDAYTVMQLMGEVGVRTL
ncbi:MAG TPA: hypothetical protein VMR98_01930, partial [Candidatus Polarisedimenticolaceae bacterium]|nr:hypothetical protein [Candidatus Polarisedimenticolaceae bacterium]